MSVNNKHGQSVRLSAIFPPEVPSLTPDYAAPTADGDEPGLPTRSNEEFRPFIRRLPEFKFWYSVTKATLIAFFCTFFEFFNIPVFWPILVMYFITLFCITMKRQIKVRDDVMCAGCTVRVRRCNPGGRLG